ncbi:hypothetical protein BT63DRAFT_452825 [Microthyrium microscopicum]|uniref:Uncharacterized protein n=1 Tax=Microthyrium microscopicum TaxID=703497 RepID=A0A6A6ULC8_9PEZI|nr:hypothetical protein BT63DRAFT_452825 [Microthyrium microscopicum]
MLPALQPHRPKISPKVVPNPQTRELHSQSAPQSQPMAPKNQIEAMPPYGSNMTPPPMPQIQRPYYNSAHIHPVFFTRSLLRPPFPLPPGAAMSTFANPAAFGYVAESGQRKDAAGRMKL